MSTSDRFSIVIILITCLALSSDAHTHVMNTGQVTLNVVGPRVYIAAALPVDAFSTSNTEEIGRQFTRSMHISVRGRVTPLQGVIVTVDEAGHDAGEAHVLLVLGVAIFDIQPMPLRLFVTPELLAKAGKLVVIASRNVDGHPREFGRRVLTATTTDVTFESPALVR